MKRQASLFYLLSFLEGASVMAAELLGAKMLAPYFGSSLYVWSAVLAITLGGLAVGYFVGGIISQRKNAERILYYVLIASALFLVIMPQAAKVVMVHTPSFSLSIAIIVSCLIFLFPPVFFMGMVSPLIVQCIAHPPTLSQREGEQEQKVLPLGKDLGWASGKTAGTVYAVSTIGGIIATFSLGFYFIPQFGLTVPAVVMGAILGIIPCVLLIMERKFFSLLFPLVVMYSFNSPSVAVAPNSEVKILYSSEGLLGQLIVADYPVYDGKKKLNGYQRILFVNRSTQTIVTYYDTATVYFEYVDLISKSPVVIRHSSSDKRALVLGLGGGSVANVLIKHGFDVDAVELDERMAYSAKTFFDLDEKVKVTVDDARHFVRSQIVNEKPQTKYDVIVLDAFVGEVNPHHLSSQESFLEIKSLLSDSGIFFINGHGYWNGEAGKGMRAMCKTLASAGYNIEVQPTNEDEDFRNILLVAKLSSKQFGDVSSETITDLNLDGDIILSDEKPQLEILNAEANKRWRESCIKYFLHVYYARQDVLIFN